MVFRETQKKVGGYWEFYRGRGECWRKGDGAYQRGVVFHHPAMHIFQVLEVHVNFI
jgi:hypothetical protein